MEPKRITLRLPESFYNRLSQDAKRYERTLNSQILYELEKGRNELDELRQRLAELEKTAEPARR